jgi:hypothetical protein
MRAKTALPTYYHANLWHIFWHHIVPARYSTRRDDRHISYRHRFFGNVESTLESNLVAEAA